MIIVKAPYRISFFGGGTDYHTWYQKHGGCVLSTSIDKYCYINLRRMQPFFNYRFRTVWREIEETIDASSIKHPAVREAYKLYDLENDRLVLHHEGDLPARSGIGSSSSFACALIKAIYTLKGRDITKSELAKAAIHLEREILQEAVGVQDQIAAAYGGFNSVKINQDGSFAVRPLNLNAQTIANLESHMLLFFTKMQRNASDIATKQISTSPEKKEAELKEMASMVSEGEGIITKPNPNYEDFGKLLHRAWTLKRGLTDQITNDDIDLIYQTALKNGAIGGKLLGAGGGGFMLIFAPPVLHTKITDALSHLIRIPFNFETEGTTLVYNKEL